MMEKKIKVQELLGSIAKNLECSICLDLLKEPVSTKCDHPFCRFCILEFLERKRSVPCPLCKAPITKRSLNERPQLKKMVEGVHKLMGAFQEDTGAVFSPPRGPPKMNLTPCTPEPLPSKPARGTKRKIIVETPKTVESRQNCRQSKRRKSVQTTEIEETDITTNDSNTPDNQDQLLQYLEQGTFENEGKPVNNLGTESNENQDELLKYLDQGSFGAESNQSGSTQHGKSGDECSKGNETSLQASYDRHEQFNVDKKSSSCENSISSATHKAKGTKRQMTLSKETVSVNHKQKETSFKNTSVNNKKNETPCEDSTHGQDMHKSIETTSFNDKKSETYSRNSASGKDINNKSHSKMDSCQESVTEEKCTKSYSLRDTKHVDYLDDSPGDSFGTPTGKIDQLQSIGTPTGKSDQFQFSDSPVTPIHTLQQRRKGRLMRNSGIDYVEEKSVDDKNVPSSQPRVSSQDKESLQSSIEFQPIEKQVFDRTDKTYKRQKKKPSTLQAINKVSSWLKGNISESAAGGTQEKEIGKGDNSETVDKGDNFTGRQTETVIDIDDEFDETENMDNECHNWPHSKENKENRVEKSKEEILLNQNEQLQPIVQKRRIFKSKGTSQATSVSQKKGVLVIKKVYPTGHNETISAVGKMTEKGEPMPEVDPFEFTSSQVTPVVPESKKNKKVKKKQKDALRGKLDFKDEGSDKIDGIWKSTIVKNGAYNDVNHERETCEDNDVIVSIVVDHEENGRKGILRKDQTSTKSLPYKKNNAMETNDHESFDSQVSLIPGSLDNTKDYGKKNKILPNMKVKMTVKMKKMQDEERRNKKGMEKLKEKIDSAEDFDLVTCTQEVLQQMDARDTGMSIDSLIPDTDVQDDIRRKKSVSFAATNVEISGTPRQTQKAVPMLEDRGRGKLLPKESRVAIARQEKSKGVSKKKTGAQDKTVTKPFVWEEDEGNDSDGTDDLDIHPSQEEFEKAASEGNETDGTDDLDIHPSQEEFEKPSADQQTTIIVSTKTEKKPIETNKHINEKSSEEKQNKHDSNICNDQKNEPIKMSQTGMIMSCDKRVDKPCDQSHDNQMGTENNKKAHSPSHSQLRDSLSESKEETTERQTNYDNTFVYVENTQDNLFTEDDVISTEVQVVPESVEDNLLMEVEDVVLDGPANDKITQQESKSDSGIGKVLDQNHSVKGNKDNAKQKIVGKPSNERENSQTHRSCDSPVMIQESDSTQNPTQSTVSTMEDTDTENLIRKSRKKLRHARGSTKENRINLERKAITQVHLNGNIDESNKKNNTNEKIYTATLVEEKNAPACNESQQTVTETVSDTTSQESLSILLPPTSHKSPSQHKKTLHSKGGKSAQKSIQAKGDNMSGVKKRTEESIDFIPDTESESLIENKTNTTQPISSKVTKQNETLKVKTKTDNIRSQNILSQSQKRVIKDVTVKLENLQEAYDSDVEVISQPDIEEVKGTPIIISGSENINAVSDGKERDLEILPVENNIETVPDTVESEDKDAENSPDLDDRLTPTLVSQRTLHLRNSAEKKRRSVERQLLANEGTGERKGENLVKTGSPEDIFMMDSESLVLQNPEGLDLDCLDMEQTDMMVPMESLGDEETVQDQDQEREGKLSGSVDEIENFKVDEIQQDEKCNDKNMHNSIIENSVSKDSLDVMETVQSLHHGEDSPKPKKTGSVKRAVRGLARKGRIIQSSGSLNGSSNTEDGSRQNSSDKVVSPYRALSTPDTKQISPAHKSQRSDLNANCRLYSTPDMQTLVESNPQAEMTLTASSKDQTSCPKSATPKKSGQSTKGIKISPTFAYSPQKPKKKQMKLNVGSKKSPTVLGTKHQNLLDDDVTSIDNNEKVKSQSSKVVTEEDSDSDIEIPEVKPNKFESLLKDDIVDTEMTDDEIEEPICTDKLKFTDSESNDDNDSIKNQHVKINHKVDDDIEISGRNMKEKVNRVSGNTQEHNNSGKNANQHSEKGEDEIPNSLPEIEQDVDSSLTRRNSQADLEEIPDSSPSRGKNVFSKFRKIRAAKRKEYGSNSEDRRAEIKKNEQPVTIEDEDQFNLDSSPLPDLIGDSETHVRQLSDDSDDQDAVLIKSDSAKRSLDCVGESDDDDIENHGDETEMDTVVPGNQTCETEMETVTPGNQTCETEMDTIPPENLMDELKTDTVAVSNRVNQSEVETVDSDIQVSDDEVVPVKKKRRRIIDMDSDLSDGSEDSRPFNTTSSSAFSSQSEPVDTQHRQKLETDLERMRREMLEIEAQLANQSTANKTDDGFKEILEPLNFSEDEDEQNNKPNSPNSDVIMEYQSDNELFDSPRPLSPPSLSPQQIDLTTEETENKVIKCLPKGQEVENCIDLSEADVDKENVCVSKNLSENNDNDTNNDKYVSGQGLKPRNASSANFPNRDMEINKAVDDDEITEKLVSKVTKPSSVLTVKQEKFKESPNSSRSSLLQSPDLQGQSSPRSSLQRKRQKIMSPLVTDRRSQKCFVSTGLVVPQMKELQKLAVINQCHFTTKFNKDVTHVIVKTDPIASRVCDRTLKFFQGISQKCWILDYQWVIDSRAAGHLKPETEYEIQGDSVTEDLHYGPQRARETVSDQLFTGLQFYVMGNSRGLQRDDLQNLLTSCGGEVLTELQDLNEIQNFLVITCSDYDTESQEDDPSPQEVIKFKELYDSHRILSISREWVLDSLTVYKLQPLTDYILTPGTINRHDIPVFGKG